MTNRMIEKLTEADPARSAEIDSSTVEAQLTQILAADRRAAQDGGRVRMRSSSRWRVAGALAGIALAAGIWLGVDFDQGQGPDGGTAYAAALIRFAEDNPRLLVSEPGWSVVGANEFAPDYGGMYFSNGTEDVELTWTPASHYESTFRDRSDTDLGAPQEINVPVGAATIFHLGGTEYTALLTPSDGTYVEVRGDLGGFDRFVSLIGSLRPTDVDSWLAALPRSIVRSADRELVVEEMLEGTPVPSGFDVDELTRDTGLITPLPQLRFEVAGRVACGWLDQWMGRGQASGVRQAEAREVLDSAAAWPIMAELPSADYILNYTEDGLGSSGLGPNTDSGYRKRLGCAP